MKTVTIEIFVQGRSENAEDFSLRLGIILKRIMNTEGIEIIKTPTISFTSSSDGRQTANIQYVSNKTINT